MRVLITGVTGFVGGHLADYLITHTSCEVWGSARHRDYAPLPSGLQLVTGDLRDPDAVVALLRQAAPDIVFHLAAQAVVPLAWRDPWGTLETNIRGQLNLITALLELRMAARMIVIGSEQQYGAIQPDDLPIDEDTPQRPNTPYGVSKVAQEALALQYHRSHGVDVVAVRAFQHIGPGQSPEFASASFARQIAQVEAGQREPVIRVGNLAAQRDFSDVRDVVAAYWALAQQGQAGMVYNVGSGTLRSVQSVLDGLIRHSRVLVRVETDPARVRPVDIPASVCDNSRLRAATGWQPVVPFDQTLADILDYWRAQSVGSSPAGVNRAG